jgi:uncharacterized protein YggT (Ycf19 family)
MIILSRLYWFINWMVIAAILVIVVLVVLRLIANQADLNPFGWSSLTIRRLTDPFIGPVRRALVGLGVDAKYAPLITILLAILLGWFAIQLVGSIANTLAGILYSLGKNAIVPIIGYVLYGLLGLYSLLIFIRIIFSWGMVSYSNLVAFSGRDFRNIASWVAHRVFRLSGSSHHFFCYCNDQLLREKRKDHFCGPGSPACVAEQDRRGAQRRAACANCSSSSGRRC